MSTAVEPHGCPRFRHARSALWLILLLAPSAHAAIPPGQEERAGRMLGLGEALPGGCRLTAAQVGPDVVSGRYGCPEGEVVLELGPPSGPGARTERFSIAATGPAPSALVAAVVERVRREEGEWLWAGRPPSPRAEERGSEAPHSGPSAWIPHVGVGSTPWLPWLALLLLAAAWVPWRRGAPPPISGRSGPSGLGRGGEEGGGLLADGTPRLFARSDVAAATTLVLAALALRLLFGVHGPLHVNGTGPLWLAGALRPELLHLYGPGYPELMALVTRLPLAPDTAIFGANALLGALVAGLAFAIGRLVGLAWSHAAIAGALLAADPVAVHMGASEAYFPGIAALTAGGAAALLLAARLALGRRFVRAAVVALAGALLCAQAARVHPAAWIPVALTPLIVLAVLGAPSLRWRLVGAAAACALVAAVTILTSGRHLASSMEWSTQGEVLTGPLQPSWGGVALVIGGAALALGWAPRARWLAVPAALSGCAAVLLADYYGQSAIWQQSFVRLYLTVPAVALAACVPARRWLLVGGVAVAALVIGFSAVPREPTTEQLEYAWLRERLLAAEPGCRLAWLGRAGDRNMALPGFLLPGAPRGAPDLVLHPGGEPIFPPGCVLYVRSSLCSSGEGRHECDAIEGRLDLEPVASVALPAVPSYRRHHYDRDALVVELSRVRAVRGGGDGATGAGARGR